MIFDLMVNLRIYHHLYLEVYNSNSSINNNNNSKIQIGEKHPEESSGQLREPQTIFRRKAKYQSSNLPLQHKTVFLSPCDGYIFRSYYIIVHYS